MLEINGYKIKPYADLSGANLREADLSEANLSEANLRGADLRGADLRWVNLSEANLRGANLRGANLREADLSEVNLSEADLREADLRWVNLSEANLREANLSEADLSGANLRGANLSEAKNVPNLPWTIIVPEGELIVYKKVNNGVAKLRIPMDAKRSNATGRKCRASYAYVLEAPEDACSMHDGKTMYKVGHFVYPDSYDENRWNECASGIHFFLTREEAENY